MNTKTEATHTPGPWICHSGMVWKPAKTKVDCACDADGDGEIPIARMDREPGNGTTPTERDANARLIAAAPAILGLLKDILEHVEDGGELRGGTLSFRNDEDAEVVIRAAIARAKGE